MSLKDDRDDLDGPIERDANEIIEETSDQQSDPVSDYQLEMDCNEMSLTIDEVSMGANDDPDTPADTSKLMPQMKQFQNNIEHSCTM